MSDRRFAEKKDKPPQLDRQNGFFWIATFTAEFERETAEMRRTAAPTTPQSLSTATVRRHFGDAVLLTPTADPIFVAVPIQTIYSAVSAVRAQVAVGECPIYVFAPPRITIWATFSMASSFRAANRGPRGAASIWQCLPPLSRRSVGTSDGLIEAKPRH
jgi:hypothetical protein